MPSYTFPSRTNPSSGQVAIDISPSGPHKPKILILVAGGTIIMTDNGNGLETNDTILDKILSTNSFFLHEEVPQYNIIYINPLIDSAQATPRDWVRLARIIRDHYNAFDGFVVIHGTDSLSYTSSALSFLLMDIHKSVVVTGSQIPLSKPYNDGFANLIGSMMIAAYSGVKEVTVFFSGQLFRGNRVQKVSAWDQDAFDSGSFPPLGKWGVNLTIRRSLLVNPVGDFNPKLKIDTNVIQIRLFPGMSASVLKSAIENDKVRGVILVCYGAGNGADNEEFYELIKSYKNEIVFVDVTQTHQGYVSFDYASSHALRDAGVIPGADMTVEAAFTKLSWLLGQEDNDIERIKAAMATPLVGEMSRIEEYWGGSN